MGYAEHRGRGGAAYWRGRFKVAPGRYGTVSHPDGSVIRFSRKLDAKRAADAEETERGTAARKAAEAEQAGRVTFTPYASAWLADLKLDPDTIDTYRGIIRHLIRTFGESWLDEITRQDIDDWEAAELAAGYKKGGVGNRRRLLSMILGDAADDPEVTLARNPAARRRGRGRRAAPPDEEDDDDDDPEEDDDAGAVIADPLTALLIAERAALLSGRDDEFTAVILAYYTGTRWGELAGLETRFVRPGKVRIRWQLRRDTVRKRPKFGKVREIDTPAWLDRLIAGHLERTSPQPCACHGRTYLFSGIGRARGARGVTLADVAGLAGVSQATVSAARHRPSTVAAATRARIEEAMASSGYTGVTGARAAHWYRSGFGQWVWTPAVSGWYPAVSPRPRRPVPVTSAPWPGLPVRGRGNTKRAGASWAPLAEGMTPHGLRHSHKSLMVELGTPEVLSHDRLGHEMPGIAGVYSHPTPPMRADLLEALTACWEKSLDERLAMCPDSPVEVLAGLLRERAVRRISPRILPDDLETGS